MKVLKINPQVYDDLVDIKASIAEDSPEQADMATMMTMMMTMKNTTKMTKTK